MASIGIYFLAAIGNVVVLLWLAKFASFVTFYFLPSGNSLKKYQRQPRAWAIATGSSGGIGLGHLQELAVRGFGVIILAHKADEVDEAAAQIKAEVKDAAVEKIVLDARTASYTDVQKALAPVMHLPITVLVNNVSVQNSVPTFCAFELYKPADLDHSFTANNHLAVYLTHILYPVLKKNGPSLVINTSSLAQIVGVPWLTMYCGTKGFTDAWSKSMARESKIEGHKIDFLTIIPGDVRTPGNVHGVGANSPTGRQFAKHALDRVGRAVSRGILSYAPYWQHGIILGLTQVLPDSLVVPGATGDIVRRKKIEEKAQ